MRKIPHPEYYRSYLRSLVENQLDVRFRSKVDLSGVVQQTLLEAESLMQEWSVWSQEQQTSWMKRALANNLIDELRKYQSCGRDVKRELSLEKLQALSSTDIQEMLHAEDTSPSNRAVRTVEVLRLSDAIAQLPFDYRRAIELRHFQSKTLAETATQLGRTKEATAMVIYRALERLRDLMQSSAPSRGDE